jgi:manganese transport protein
VRFAIAACDLAEVLGAAIALNLLFGLPLIWGVCLTALDVLIVLFLQNRGFRYVEALVVGLILMIASCFAIELWLARPDPAGRRSRLRPVAGDSPQSGHAVHRRSAFWARR